MTSHNVNDHVEKMRVGGGMEEPPDIVKTSAGFDSVILSFGAAGTSVESRRLVIQDCKLVDEKTVDRVGGGVQDVAVSTASTSDVSSSPVKLEPAALAEFVYLADNRPVRVGGGMQGTVVATRRAHKHQLVS